ncbi:MAG: sulfite exporter TauE/SafE family protein, partial [Flavobacterium sp.]|nr:sulfite exporter TauE/SafE family protein [Flavobacterium sp.]
LNPIVGTAYSLFIVGTTSAFGTILNYRKGLVDVRKAISFAIPSFIAVFLTRKFLVPALPEILYQNDSISIERDIFIMVLFGTVMLMAAMAMLRKKSTPSEVTEKPNTVFTIIKIFGIGVLIGLIGAGGGFLIIPALYYVARLPMRIAIGTSLMIIALNSLIGFTGDIGNFPMDWWFLMKFSSLSIAGIFIGIYIGRFFNENMLRRIFGIFVLIMAIAILSCEIFGT